MKVTDKTRQEAIYKLAEEYAKQERFAYNVNYILSDYFDEESNEDLQNRINELGVHNV